MDAHTHRTFAMDVRELRRMSAWWREWAVQAAVPARTVEDGELCLNEAAGNIIRHGGTAHGAGPIEIAFERSPDAVRMTIVDSQRPFNPLDSPVVPPAVSLEEAGVGGLGIPLMRVHASALQYRREEGRNILMLTFTPIIT